MKALKSSWLVPVVVVVIIAAIVSAVALPSSSNTSDQSKNSSRSGASAANNTSDGNNDSSGNSPNGTSPKLSVATAQEKVSKNSEITVEVWADSGTEKVNAVQIVLSYPQDKLQYKSVDASGSAFPIAASAKASGGKVTIARGAATPISGHLLVAKVHFTVLAGSGEASVQFTKSTALVSATTHKNVLESTSGNTFTLTP